MEKTISVTLDAADVLQIIDGLNDRAEAWERTAAHLNGNNQADELFIAEECGDPDEAARIARHFRDIVRKLEAQS